MRISIHILILAFLLSSLSVALAETEAGWKEIKSTHFIIYYKDIPEGFLDKVQESAEQYYKEITNNLGFIRYDFWLWDRRAKIYIYSDRESYLQEKNIPKWSGAIAYYQEKRINTFPWDAGFFDTVLPHELGHIIFREFIGDNPTVPLWMDEGVACFQELSKRWSSKKMVKNVIANKTFIPLDQLSNPRSIDFNVPDNVELFYAEAASAVGFLLQRFGDVRFTGLCSDLREGKEFLKAIKNNYPYNDLTELNSAWIRYLED